MIDLTCSACRKEFKIADPSISIEEAEGCTLDCPHCNELLVVNNGETERFHSFMHDVDPGWPEDGKDTGHVEF